MTTATKERPILFSSTMVRAIIDGRKTQTRRVVKLDAELRGRGCASLEGSWWDPSFGGRLKVPGPHETTHRLFCPYGLPGERLWVRETWQHEDGSCDDHKCGQPTHIYHKATESFPESIRWRPSIFMPRWASRITLEVTSVRVERVKEISEEDAEAEGVKRGSCNCTNWAVCGYSLSSYRLAYSKLWESINAKRGFGWDKNPWVWVIEFKRVTE